MFEDSTTFRNELLTEMNDSFFSEVDLPTLSESFQMISTQRGKRKLLLDGYIYRLDRANDRGVEQWRCSKKSCRGRIHLHQTSNDFPCHITLVSSHCHPAEPGQCQAAMLVDHLRSTAEHNPHESPKQIVNRLLRSVNDETAANLPSTTAMQRSIQRRRQQQKSFETFSIDDEQQEKFFPSPIDDQQKIQIIFRSIDDQNFSNHQNQIAKNQILVLTNENLFQTRQRLIKSEFWLCKTLNEMKNHFFRSLFVLEILDEDKETFLPVFYALFSSISSEFYLKFFERIFPVDKPKFIITNFDSILIDAMKKFFFERKTTVEIKISPIFLYEQIFQSFKKNSLIDDDEQKSFKYLLSLTFIPRSDVVGTFENLEKFCTKSTDQIYNKFEDLCIGRLRPNGNRSPPKFDSQLWNWSDAIDQFENIFIINSNIKQSNEIFRSSIIAGSQRNLTKILRTIQQLHQHKLNTKNRYQQSTKTSRIVHQFYLKKFKEIVQCYKSFSFEEFLIDLFEYLPIF